MLLISTSKPLGPKVRATRRQPSRYSRHAQVDEIYFDEMDTTSGLGEPPGG